MKIIVRGWGDGRLLFEDPIESDELDAALALGQVALMARYPQHMLEIEFLEEPDPQQRFFRFGTDKSMMVDPQESIRCPKCGLRSFNPNDIKHRYCGNCHEFHEACNDATRS